MMHWLFVRRDRVLLGVLAAAALAMASCSTVRGLRHDFNAVSYELQSAVFGYDPDAPPND